MTTPPSSAPETPTPPTQQRLIAIGVIGMVIMLIIAGVAILAVPYALDRARPGAAALGKDGVQEITVEVANGVYAPNVLKIRAGTPLRLRVVVRDLHSCATKLLVPDLGLDFDLPTSGTAALELPAMRPGSYLFTCGQKMVKGSIVVE